jgi:hypothetical protein
VAGTDISHSRLGPLSVARIASGRAFTAADETGMWPWWTPTTRSCMA